MIDMAAAFPCHVEQSEISLTIFFFWRVQEEENDQRFFVPQNDSCCSIAASSNELMKTHTLLLSALLLPLTGFAQVNSGSDGHDGALNPASSLVIDMADRPTLSC